MRPASSLTMTISIGSYEDLEPRETRPIDRNPDIPCHECGESQSWDEWQEQYHEITPETKLRCPGCWGQLIEQARIERKQERHKQITEF